MVTGRKAFGDGDAAGVQREILEVMPPAPNELNRTVQIGISRVIMKALAKNPEYRFQRAGDLVSELEAECGTASRPSLPGVPQINVPQVNVPPPALPRLETGSPMIPGLSTNLGSVTLSASAAPSAPPIEPAPSFAAKLAPATPSWVTSSVRAVAAPAAAAPSEARETIVPPPPRAAAASRPISLTPQQIKILVGVIGAALVVMVSVMIADGVRARRMQAEAEAAAAAPLMGTAMPDPLTASPVSEPEPQPTAIQIVPATRTAKARRKAVVAPAALAVGELAINSVPEGAQVQVDGRGAGLTPVALANLSPGQHLVVLSKAGYAVESRSVLVQGGTRAALAVSLGQLAAVAAIASEPPGAAIIIDGRDTGKVTPAKLVVGQGNHSLVLRKAGYLQTSASMALNPGETFQFLPTLKPLGNADDIKQVGKFKKLLGRGGQEGTARVQVRTFPKGAQIMFNQRMMDRASPAEFLLGPGTYEVTLTLTGYRPVRKTITVESNGRMEVNETFER